VRRRGEYPRMTDRAIEVDKKAAYGRGYKRRPESLRQRLCHDQSPNIVSAMRGEQRAILAKV